MESPRRVSGDPNNVLRWSLQCVSGGLKGFWGIRNKIPGSSPRTATSHLESRNGFPKANGWVPHRRSQNSLGELEKCQSRYCMKTRFQVVKKERHNPTSAPSIQNTPSLFSLIFYNFFMNKKFLVTNMHGPISHLKVLLLSKFFIPPGELESPCPQGGMFHAVTYLGALPLPPHPLDKLSHGTPAQHRVSRGNTLRTPQKIHCSWNSLQMPSRTRFSDNRLPLLLGKV